MPYAFKTEYPSLQDLSLYETTYCIWELCQACNEIEKVHGKNDSNTLTGAVLEAYESALENGFLTEQPDGLVTPLTKWYCQNGSFKSNPTWEEFISEEVEEEEEGTEEFLYTWVPNINQISVFWSENLCRLYYTIYYLLHGVQFPFYKDIAPEIVFYLRTAGKMLLRDLEEDEPTLTQLISLYYNVTYFSGSMLSSPGYYADQRGGARLTGYNSLEQDYPTLQKVTSGVNIIRYIDYFRVVLKRLYYMGWFVGDHRPFCSNKSDSSYDPVNIKQYSGTTYTKKFPGSLDPVYLDGTWRNWFSGPDATCYPLKSDSTTYAEREFVWDELYANVGTGGETVDNNIVRLTKGIDSYTHIIGVRHSTAYLNYLRPITMMSFDIGDRPAVYPFNLNIGTCPDWYVLGRGEARQYTGELCTKHILGEYVTGGLTYFIFTRSLANGCSDFTTSSDLYIEEIQPEGTTWVNRIIFEQWVPDISSQTPINQIQLDTTLFPFKYLYTNYPYYGDTRYYFPMKEKHAEDDIIPNDRFRAYTRYWNPYLSRMKTESVFYAGRHYGAYSAYLNVPTWLRVDPPFPHLVGAGSRYEIESVSEFANEILDKTTGEIIPYNEADGLPAYIITPQVVTDIAAYLPYLEET